jgi:hypothetical protein
VKAARVRHHFATGDLGKGKPLNERISWTRAAEVLRHLSEDRPFGRVVLAG